MQNKVNCFYLHFGYKQFLTGSRRFFSRLDGFKSDDFDYIRIFENQAFDLIHLSPGNSDIYCFGDISKIIPVIKSSTNPQTVVTLLIPEIAKELELTTPNILNEFQKYFENLKPKHTYLKFIKDCYIQNNSWNLSDKQLLKAFEIYVKSKEK